MSKYENENKCKNCIHYLNFQGERQCNYTRYMLYPKPCERECLNCGHINTNTPIHIDEQGNYIICTECGCSSNI